MESISARSLFSQATGFIRRGGFDYTCNPYVGCTFGCTYCYAAFLPQSRAPVSDWGRWLKAKVNAVALAHQQGPKIAGAALYMSSVTDPYLPIERSLQLTRGILEAILPYQPRLVVQTRGPLVLRDIDLIQAFQAVRVNFSIPTDCEEVRMSFEPKAPPLEERWRVVRELKASGIAVGLCITPTLPIRQPREFIRQIADLDAEVVVTQDFHDAQGRFGADTGPVARRRLAESNWSLKDYADFVAQLRAAIGRVYEGEEGFFPPSGRSAPISSRGEISAPSPEGDS